MSVFNVKFLPSKQLFAARSAEPTGRAGGRAGAGFGSDPSVSFPPERYRPPCFSAIKHGFIILIGMGGGVILGIVGFMVSMWEQIRFQV